MKPETSPEKERIAREASIEFGTPGDDTSENRAVVATVRERSTHGSGNDTDLDDAIREFGYDPADFMPE